MAHGAILENKKQGNDGDKETCYLIIMELL